MTYIADLDPNSTLLADAEARAEAFATVSPDWEVSEGYGDRFVSERDFPLDTHDADMVSVEDWEAYLEASWTDPAER